MTATKGNPMQDALDVVTKVFADPDAFPRDFVAFPLRADNGFFAYDSKAFSARCDTMMPMP